ncbi:hypothetical protein [Streptomyces thermolilacinus]|uniref:hypothetical protein n=1 Tax=Streptomyces thermolilacinus TaxID=285540 RepID=UPI0033E1C74A
MAEKDDEKTTTSGTPSTGGRRTPARDTESAETATKELAVDPEEPGIDPRLDNRTGDQRPKLEDFPAKPQQIDGPEVGETPTPRARGRKASAEGPRKGRRSPGPHGLGDTADQV